MERERDRDKLPYNDCVCHLIQAVNIGEVLDSWVPEELTEEDKVGGRWWRQLLAGGGAGAGWPQSCDPLSWSHDPLTQSHDPLMCSLFSVSVQDLYCSS